MQLSRSAPIVNGRNLRRSIICAALFASLTAQAGVAEVTSPQSIEVAGTQFVVTLANGQVLHSAELVGATLSVISEAGPMRLRIDSVEPDPGDNARSALASNAGLLHSFFYQTPQGEWRNLCVAGPDGRRQGFPLAGRARKDGTMEPAERGVFKITCTSGAQGKCVRLGYRPWENGPDGLMWNLFNSCIRLMRADYSGDGIGTTRDGRSIDIYDFLGIQSKGDDLVAGRVQENTSLAALEANVVRLKGRNGAICTEQFARTAGAVLFNRSPP